METQNISNDSLDGGQKNNSTGILNQVVTNGPKNSSNRQEGKELAKIPPGNGQSGATKSRSSTRRTSRRNSRSTKTGSGLQGSSPPNHKQNVRTFSHSPKYCRETDLYRIVKLEELGRHSTKCHI